MSRALRIAAAAAVALAGLICLAACQAVPVSPLERPPDPERGEMVGRVVDAEDKPIAGVAVRVGRNYVPGAFAWPSPHVTEAAQVTDEAGRFRFSDLIPGPYCVRFSHPERVSIEQYGVAVGAAGLTEIADVTVPRGVRVCGVARVDGVPSEGVRVMIASAGPSPDPQSVALDVLSAADGRFVFVDRVPAGQIVVSAARIPEPPNGDSFRLVREFMEDQRASRTEVTASGDEEWVEVAVNIITDR